MNARIWRMGTALVLLTALFAIAGWGEGVVPLGIIPTPPTGTTLQSTIWVDRGVYAVGESITIHYNVNKQAYVYIWDITPEGECSLIFPNSAVPGWSNNYVTAGDHTLTGSVTPPLGTEYLQILASTTPVTVFEGMTGDPVALLAQIQVQVLGIVPASEVSWNVTSFEIVEGSVPARNKLIISSTPGGAAIYLNDAYQGYTPRTVYVPSGSYRLSLVKSGYQTWQSWIFLSGSATRNIAATLVPIAPVNQAPVSSFTYSAATDRWFGFNGAASTDADGTIASYAWNYGDGTTGTGVSQWHQYASPGTYTVTLTVTDNLGATGTSSQIVQAGPTNQAPVAAFVTSPSVGTPGGWIQFNASTSSDADGTIVAYAWNYGDGHTSTTGPVDWWSYASAGTYNVTLTVTDNQGATNSVTRAVQVGSLNQPPTAAFAVPAPVTVSVPARFDGSTSTDADGWIASHQWTFGDGYTASGSVVYHAFAAVGTYPVTLTVTDNGGATNSVTQSVVVGVPMQAPVAAFTYSPSSPIVGTPVVFNASSSYDPDGAIVSYQWDLNGDGTTDASGISGQVTYSTPGTAQVRLTVTDNSGLSASATQVLVVAASGGSGGAPAMGTTPGFFIWGTDLWHITVNAGAGWTTPRNYRIELRTNGTFTGVNSVWSGGVAPMGIIPTPTTSGKTVIFENALQTGSVDYTFTIPGATSMWLSLKMDTNGDSTLEETTSFVYLRSLMVHPPANAFVVGLPSGSTGNLLPSLNFRIGTAWTYTETRQYVFWSTTIGALESL